jgi:tRNA dimethylallyltransferase
VRALEVIAETGQSLAEWQKVREPPILNEADTVRLLLTLDRAELQVRADARFDRMVAGGALEEVRVIAGMGLDPALPAMRAIGVRPLLSAINGERSLEDAFQAVKLETRQYIKRQETWFKSHMISWKEYNTQYMESNRAEIFAFIQGKR